MNFEYPIASTYIEDLEMHVKMLEKKEHYFESCADFCPNIFSLCWLTIVKQMLIIFENKHVKNITFRMYRMYQNAATK